MASSDTETKSPAAPPGEPAAKGPAGKEPAAKRRGLSPRVRILAAVAVVAVVVGGFLYWLHARRFVSTDDAEIDGHLHPVSAVINGTVLSLDPRVEDNRYVTAGTVLAQIDPADYQAQVAQAEAEVARLQASAEASQAQVPVIAANATGQLAAARASLAQAKDALIAARASLSAARTRVVQAEAAAKRTEDDRARYESLIAKQEISRSEYERRVTEAEAARAALAGARADVAAAQGRVGEAEGKIGEQQGNVQKASAAPQQIAASRAQSGSAGADLARARAQLELARLNLAHTKIIAPVSGIIGRRSVETGQRVQPGQELLTVIEVEEVWVTANFKETQLERIRPGQPAKVHVDSYDRDYTGKVESIAAATGSRFSLLPPENATGNFVKVVQRLPVRIDLDKGQDPQRLLRPGMSVDVSVTVR